MKSYPSHWATDTDDHSTGAYESSGVIFVSTTINSHRDDHRGLVTIGEPMTVAEATDYIRCLAAALKMARKMEAVDQETK